MIKSPTNNSSHHTFPLRLPRPLLDRLDAFGLKKGSFKTRTALIVAMLTEYLDIKEGSPSPGEEQE